MSKLAAWLARPIWYGMLWLMRRRWMRRLQNASLRLVPENRRARAYRSMVSQNALARRMGLPLVSFSITVLLASVLLTVVFRLALSLVESGILVPSESFRERVLR